ncbi:unnamed protein product [Ranitomeya imitator]|uniref:Endonuclease/exonuclease/phosphatase domain-containing protein n=1 Tax=Ranitomeya imitator TaxID=111125 RepID=A0ABN9L3J2_9NEOB|nr:unnamed protein product [Ranitomeya imitator]
MWSALPRRAFRKPMFNRRRDYKNQDRWANKDFKQKGAFFGNAPSNLKINPARTDLPVGGTMGIQEGICLSPADTTSDSDQEDKGGQSKRDPNCSILAQEAMVFLAESHVNLRPLDPPGGSGSSLPGPLQPPSCEGSTTNCLELERQLLKMRGFSNKGHRKGAGITKGTLSRWIRDAICLAYSSKGENPPEAVRAHSTRAIASSSAERAEVPLEQIFYKTEWVSYNLNDVSALSRHCSMYYGTATQSHSLEIVYKSEIQISFLIVTLVIKDQKTTHDAFTISAEEKEELMESTKKKEESSFDYRLPEDYRMKDMKSTMRDRRSTQDEADSWTYGTSEGDQEVMDPVCHLQDGSGRQTGCWDLCMNQCPHTLMFYCFYIPRYYMGSTSTILCIAGGLDSRPLVVGVGMDLQLEWMTLEDFQRHLDGSDEIIPRDPISNSALKEAVKNGDYLTVKYALKSNEEYNLDQEDSSGMTLVMMAAASGQDDILRLLIKKGAKINASQRNGTTALIHATEKNYLTTVALLLEAGAFVNMQQTTGETALMKACKKGNVDTVRLLIEHGADCNVLTKHQNNALQFAKQSDNMVFELLNGHLQKVYETNKMEELEAEISTGNFDIVGITETWLDESYDWAVNLQGYSLFRKDRKNRRGGGVCLYVKSCLKSTLREDISEGNEDVESIWVEIHGGKNGNKILVGVCYKPPNITETMESLLLKQIDEAATHNEVLVMGDFNYPDINRFLLITKKNYLSQLVQNPTRGAALLDLILSNRPDRITNLQVVGHLGNSDHNIVQFHLSFTRGTCQGVTKTLNFRKAKFDQLRDALNLVDWDNILRNKNTDNKWEMFKNILNRQCKRFIPCGNKRTRNRKNPMWLNKEVRQAINSKKKAFALLKQDGTIEALKNYREKNTLSKKTN